jgi:hypothetical protein
MSWPTRNSPGALACLLALSGCAAAPQTPGSGAEAASSSQDVLPVIDVHTHTYFDGRLEETSKIPVTREQYLKERREAGVVASISHVGDAGEGYNADMKAQDVFHCFGIGQEVDLVRLEQGLASRDYRCVKIYLGYIHRFAYEAPYRDVYAIAQKHGVPVVFHTGDTYSTTAKLKYADPLTIDEVAVDFPKVTFVIAHMGNPWIQSAAEVAYKNPNVYIEGSAFAIGDLSKKDPQSAAKLETYVIEPIRWTFGYIANPSKVMYGTDWPLTGMKDYLEAYKKAIPREHWCKVFFENAITVFHLEEVGQRYTCHVK